MRNLNLFYAVFVLTLLSACNFNGDPKGQNYTVPSWTLYQRALQSGQTVQEAKSLLVPKNYPYNINTTIHGDPSMQMGVAWFTNADVTGGAVQIVEGKASRFFGISRRKEIPAVCVAVDTINYLSLGTSNKEIIATTGFVAGEKRSYTSNKALITGLKPNTYYSFRVGKKGAWSEIGSFTTAGAKKESFNFIYITDPQANTDEMFDVSKETIEKAYQYVPNARFMLIAGDIINSPGAYSSEWEWEQWHEKMQHIWLRLPMVPVQGNHDTSPFNNWFHHFNTDISYNMQQSDEESKTTMDGTVYSFVYGNAQFLIINFEDLKKGEPYFLALEQWIRKQIADCSGVKWRIIAFHRTMFTGVNSRLTFSEGITLRSRFVSVFQDLDIDLVIQGHDHLYQVFGVLAADGANYRYLSDAVTDQTIVTPTHADGRSNSTDVTGKQGGTFNVSNGMVFFLNNSAGKKKYYPSSKEQIEDAYPQHGIKNYFDFINKFGQTGEPTFSKISVMTDTIHIATYTVSNTSEVALFDEFRIVKNNILIPSY